MRGLRTNSPLSSHKNCFEPSPQWRYHPQILSFFNTSCSSKQCYVLEKIIDNDLTVKAHNYLISCSVRLDLIA
jgi:hypothetical protein